MQRFDMFLHLYKKHIFILTGIIAMVPPDSFSHDNIDTIFHPDTIPMVESLSNLESPIRNKFGGYLSFTIDILNPSFDSFESVLGKENVDNLNRLNVCGSGELAVWHKDLYFALNIGGHRYDTVNVNKGGYKTFLLGTHFGYNIINSKRFLITPKIGIKWYRYRMTNYDGEKRIPMEQYITGRDLDIRFNHLVGFTGLGCAFKFDAIAIGFYGEYVFKLNDKPWVYSRQNRLTTDHKIDFGKFNFGINLSFVVN